MAKEVIVGGGPDDVEGQADAGEEVDEIVQVLEREDREAMVEEEILADAPDEDGDEDEDDDDDDDDDDDVQGNHPIPEEWNRDDLATMEAMDMQRSRFQSGCTMIQVKQAFRNKQELKDAVSHWAVMSLREVYVKTSSPLKYSVKCRAPGCTFYVRAFVPKNELHWIASIVQGHSCTLQNSSSKYRNLTASLIANDLYSEIIGKKDMECSFIQRAVERQYKYEITYQKA